MKIFIDLDRVIYNTARIIRRTDVLLRSFGIDPKEWQRAWKAGLYTLEGHLRRYQKSHRLDREKFLEAYQKFHQGVNYLFPEARQFLKEAKKIGELVLITHGDREFQRQKIWRTKIDHFFRQIVIVPSKKVFHIDRLINRRDLNVLIDDNAVEIDLAKKRFPEILTIHLRRPRDKYWNLVSDYTDFEIMNLNQALVILQLINETFAKDINKAVQYLKKGKAVVYPTDTCYGLAVDATNGAAVKKLYKIKERGAKQPVHVIVPNLTAVEKLAIVDPLARKLMKKFWPGALTLVLPLRPPLFLPLMRGRKSGGRGAQSLNILSAGTATIGVRMPDNEVALELVKKLGRPITTTSANPSARKSGGTAPYSAIDSFKQFFLKKHQPDLYLDYGILPKQKPSTVVRVEKGKIKLLRKGPIKV